MLEKAKKIIDMSSSVLCESKRKAVAGMHSFSWNNHLSIVYLQRKETCVETHLQNKEFIENFSNLGLFTSVTEEVSDSLEKSICQLCGYKNESSVDKVRIVNQIWNIIKCEEIMLLIFT